MSLAGIAAAVCLSVRDTIQPRYTAVNQSPATLPIWRNL